MKNRKIVLIVVVIIGVAIALVGIHFGASWLIDKIPGHVRPPH